MATQAYHDWVAAGRPFNLATPIKEYLAAFHAAGWPFDTLGTIGDEAHLQAARPQDHCPFSVTGWPDPNRYPYVCAFDAGHDPANGRDMNPVVAYWLSEARAGRTPWVKYIVWRGQIYDVRDGWAALPAVGHFDHAHMSIRTDWTGRSIGTFKPVGRITAVSSTTTGQQVWSETINSVSDGYVQAASEFLKWTYTNHLALDRLEAAVKALSAAVGPRSGDGGSEVDPQALAAALAGNTAFVDALATSVAAKLGIIPTAGEIAKAVGLLTWQGKVV